MHCTYLLCLGPSHRSLDAFPFLVKVTAPWRGVLWKPAACRLYTWLLLWGNNHWFDPSLGNLFMENGWKSPQLMAAPRSEKPLEGLLLRWRERSQEPLLVVPSSPVFSDTEYLKEARVTAVDVKEKESLFLIGTQICDFGCASGPRRERLPALTSCLQSFEFRCFRPELL